MKAYLCVIKLKLENGRSTPECLAVQTEQNIELSL